MVNLFLKTVRAALILKQLGLEPLENCINHLMDEKGQQFYIPNFCINDPYFEKQIKVDNSLNVKDKILKVDNHILIFFSIYIHYYIDFCYRFI
jgi:hypothetical protein